MNELFKAPIESLKRKWRIHRRGLAQVQAVLPGIRGSKAAGRDMKSVVPGLSNRSLRPDSVEQIMSHIPVYRIRAAGIFLVSAFAIEMPCEFSNPGRVAAGVKISTRKLPGQKSQPCNGGHVWCRVIVFFKHAFDLLSYFQNLFRGLHG